MAAAQVLAQHCHADSVAMCCAVRSKACLVLLANETTKMGEQRTAMLLGSCHEAIVTAPHPTEEESTCATMFPELQKTRCPHKTSNWHEHITLIEE